MKTILKLITLALLSACNPADLQDAIEDEGGSNGLERLNELVEEQYTCVKHNAFSLDDEIDLYVTITFPASPYESNELMCEVVDPATGAQLAVGQGSVDICDVNYLDKAIEVEVGKYATARIRYTSLSTQFDSCEKNY